MLNRDEIKAIAVELHELFKDEQIAHWVEPEVHAEQHRFITAWMKELERKAALREKVKANVFGWLAITIIGGIGWLGWKYVVPGIIKGLVGGTP